MAPPPSLLDFVASALEASVPGSHRYSLNVVRSEPQRSHALFPHASNAKTAKVYHEETLVVLSEKRTVASTPTVPRPPAEGAALALPAADRDTEEHLVPVAALEAALYFVPSSSCALLYISKVDTTGLSSSPVSPTRTLVSAFVAYHLLHAPHHAQRLRVHVFARAQAQYLFPGSADNAPAKRVLDDNALIRWWKGTLERASAQRALPDGAVQRFYLVPGLSLAESLPYVPALPGTAPWVYGHANSTLSSPLHAPASPAAHPLTDHVPAFPDDPKARFLHSLASSPVEPSGAPGDYDDAYRALSSATFSAGTTPAQKAAELDRQVDRERRRLVEGVPGGVDEWWERMAFRQECCAGALVAFFVLAIGEPADLVAAASASALVPSDPPAASPSSTVAAPPSSPSKKPGAPAAAAPPRRSVAALRPAQYTKLWSTLHNFDYTRDPATASAAAGAGADAPARLGTAVARWAEGVERAARGTWDEERRHHDRTAGADNVDADAEWAAVWAREGARDVRVENPLPPPLLRGEGQDVRAGGEKRAAVDEDAPKKVNVLAPRKKKKVAPAPPL
ncbi:hypothetical protein JCM3770_001100 [Rhodotorula araucariae]